MRAGILTFHGADNYGAVLQAYGLQRAIEALGADSELVEFCQPPRQENPPAAMGKGPAALFAEKIRQGGARRSALFDDFRQKRLCRSRPFQPEETAALNERYDVFLAGSDQIWNPTLPEADSRYFLPFAPSGKRFSYAASFGMGSLPDQVRERYARQISGFRGLSVREEEGRELVRTLTGRDCTVCVDPVLLPEPKVWEELTGAGVSGEPYLFLFMVNYDSQLAAWTKQEAETRGLVLRVVTGGFMPQYGMEAWNSTGVEDWLRLIRGAAGVCTNSFHGTAFALLFGRPVLVAPLKDGLSHRNGRLEELLSLAGVDLAAGGLVEIPPERFAERIRERKETSLQYLREALAAGNVG